jgi:hypothetical protein
LPDIRKQAAPAPIAMDAFGNMLRDVGTIASLTKSLATAANRHGDLQVIRSCAKHIIESADVLIAQEQS